MKTSDYRCPNCKRVRAIKGRSPSVNRLCGCTSAPVTMLRIQWEAADWTLTTTPLAESMGLLPSTVAKKRVELGKPRGTKGRKPRSHDSYHRKATAPIDPARSVKENAATLGVTPSRIRQMLKNVTLIQ